MHKFFWFLLIFLSSWGHKGYADAGYGDLHWDYEKYKKDRELNSGMAYVRDLNQRIQEALEGGNIPRSTYLSTLLTELIVTGGPFGLAQRPANADELKDFNRSAALIGKSAYESAFAHVGRAGPDALTLRTKNILDGFLKPNVYEISSEPQAEKHKSIFNTLIKTHLQSNTSFLFPQETIQVENFIASSDIKYATALFKTQVISKLPKWFYVNEKGQVVIRDFVRDQEFYLLETPPNGSCFFHAASGDSKYTTQRFAEEKLKKLNDPQRHEVALMLAEFFGNRLKNENIFKDNAEFSELLNSQEFQKEFKRIHLGENPGQKFPLYTRFTEFISKKENFDRLIDEDLVKKSTWQPIPSRVTSSYSSVYVYLQKKHVAILGFSCMLNGDVKIVVSNNHFLNYSAPYDFIIYNGFDREKGNIHFSRLLPKNSITSDPNYKPSLPFANESYLKAWHKLA